MDPGVIVGVQAGVPIGKSFLLNPYLLLLPTFISTAEDQEGVTLDKPLTVGQGAGGGSTNAREIGYNRAYPRPPLLGASARRHGMDRSPPSLDARRANYRFSWPSSEATCGRSSSMTVLYGGKPGTNGPSHCFQVFSTVTSIASGKKLSGPENATSLSAHFSRTNAGKFDTSRRSR